jgi:hypothetical protein
MGQLLWLTVWVGCLATLAAAADQTFMDQTVASNTAIVDPFAIVITRCRFAGDLAFSSGSVNVSASPAGVSIRISDTVVTGNFDLVLNGRDPIYTIVIERTAFVSNFRLRLALPATEMNLPRLNITLVDSTFAGRATFDGIVGGEAYPSFAIANSSFSQTLTLDNVRFNATVRGRFAVDGCSFGSSTLPTMTAISWGSLAFVLSDVAFRNQRLAGTAVIDFITGTNAVSFDNASTLQVMQAFAGPTPLGVVAALSTTIFFRRVRRCVGSFRICRRENHRTPLV